MNDGLEALYAELEKVKSSPFEYLAEYGYSSKDEIIDLIEEDIKDVTIEQAKLSFDYTEEELEYERLSLCLTQGMSRYC